MSVVVFNARDYWLFVCCELTQSLSLCKTHSHTIYHTLTAASRSSRQKGPGSKLLQSALREAEKKAKGRTGEEEKKNVEHEKREKTNMLEAEVFVVQKC